MAQKEMPRTGDTAGFRPTRAATMKELYAKAADDFAERIGKLLQRRGVTMDIENLEPRKVKRLNSALMRSREYWKSLDDVYRVFRKKAVGLNELDPDIRIPKANEARARILTTLLERTPQKEAALLAEHALKSMGMDGAWRRLGTKLRKHPELEVEEGFMESERPKTLYERFRPKARAAFAQSENLRDFLYKAFEETVEDYGEEKLSPEAKARLLEETVGEVVESLSKDDRGLLEASVRLQVPPSKDVFPDIKWWRRWASRSAPWRRRAQKASLAGLWGEAKSIKTMVAETFKGNWRDLPGFRTVWESAYREKAMHPKLDKVTWGGTKRVGKWAVGLTLVAFAVYKCFGESKVRSMVGGTPEKLSEYGQALEGVASIVNQQPIIDMHSNLEVEVGGEKRKLTEEEKTTACAIAAPMRGVFTKRRETMTDYVHAVSILQFMPGEKGKELKKRPKVAELAMLIRERVKPEGLDYFSKAALKVASKKGNAGKSAEQIFSETVLSDKKAEGQLSINYWGRPFTLKKEGMPDTTVFAHFYMGANSPNKDTLPSLRAMLRKAAWEKKITGAQMGDLAVMFASLYTVTDKHGRPMGVVPAEHGADVEYAISELKKGRKISEIKDALFISRKYQGGPQRELATKMNAKGFDVETIDWLIPQLGWYSPDRLPGAVKWLGGHLEPAAHPELRDVLMEHMESHVGWMVQRADVTFSSYVNLSIGDMVNKDFPELSASLTQGNRNAVIGYLAARFQADDPEKRLTYAQVIRVVRALAGASADTLKEARKKLAGRSRKAGNEFMDDFVEEALARQSGEAAESPPAE